MFLQYVSLSVFVGTSSVVVFLETCSVYIHNAFFKFTVYPKQLALFKIPSPMPLTPTHSENLHLYFRFFSCHSSLYFYSLLLCQCKQTQLSSENLCFLIISWLLPQDESRAYQQPLGLSALP